MLTEQQKNWLNHLSDTNVVKIVPYNPRVKEVFRQQQSEIQSVLGKDTIVLHKGASAWGISGKGDVDIYIPVPAEQFDSSFEQLKQSLGEPGSHYSLERVRWNRIVEDIEVEIFLANKDATFYKDSLAFWEYMETHPEALEEYRILKEQAEGTTSREYYTRKTIFINKIMQLIRATK